MPATIEALRSRRLPGHLAGRCRRGPIDAALAAGRAAAVRRPAGQRAGPRLRAHAASREPALAGAAAIVEGTFETSFVEHAYIEPEAGFARRVGDSVEVHVTTQTPYMDRDEVAPHPRPRPGAGAHHRRPPCGGGFGGKLDLSVQPYVALAAWLTGRPVRARLQPRANR